jgi:hypothetical protein
MSTLDAISPGIATLIRRLDTTGISDAGAVDAVRDAADAMKRRMFGEWGTRDPRFRYVGPDGPTPSAAEIVPLATALAGWARRCVGWSASDTDAWKEYAEFDQSEALTAGAPGIQASGAIMSAATPAPASEWEWRVREADRRLNELREDTEKRHKATADLPHQALPAVDAEDIAILQALSRRAPRLLTQDEIEAECKGNPTRRTISARAKRLINDGLIETPHGPKSGYTITPPGKHVLALIDGSIKVAR